MAISVTDSLDLVSYRAKIVGWEDKSKLSPSRLEELNKRIREYQPGEKEGTYKTGNTERPSNNLISVIEMEKLALPIPVQIFIKISDNSPLKPRTTPGKWSYVRPVPDWLGSDKRFSISDEESEHEFQVAILESSSLTEAKRAQRLELAPKIPEVIQTISLSFRRNPDVVASVLNRANGKCEYCGNDAPFLRASSGTPYLEVHHKKMLAEGGEDTVENAVAVCPNCHRKAHFGV